MAGGDYITLLPTVHFNRWIVAIMRCAPGDEYVVGRMSQTPLKRDAAEALAKSWAAASRLEVR